MADRFSLKITQASLNQCAFDWARNMSNIFKAIDCATREGSDILCFEEMTITGYDSGDYFDRSDNDRITQALTDIAEYAEKLDPSLIISIGHPWRLLPDVAKDIPADRLPKEIFLPFNVQTVISCGKILGMSAKSNLYNYGRGYEKRYFSEWQEKIGQEFNTVYIPFGNEERIAFGKPIFRFCSEDGTTAFNLFQVICEEKWIGSKYDISISCEDDLYQKKNIIASACEYLGSSHGLIVPVSNASPPAKNSIDKHVYLACLASEYADLVIDTDGLGSSGSSFSQFGHKLIASKSEIIAYGKRNSFCDVDIATNIAELQSAPPKTCDKIHVMAEHVFKHRNSKPSLTISYLNDSNCCWDNPENADRHYEEIIRNTALWLFDYLRKNKIKGVVQALSGGADSAFNAVIVYVMTCLAVKEIGAGKFCDELNLKCREQAVKSERKSRIDQAISLCMSEIMTCVYMATNNNSEQTQNAARYLIRGDNDNFGIGGKFIFRNIQEIVNVFGASFATENLYALEDKEKQEFINDISAYLNASPDLFSSDVLYDMRSKIKQKYPQIENLITASDGIVYENIQARARAVFIMTVANHEGKIAISNSNLDEARNAYATFAGDLHAGTINLNAHINKAYLIKLLVFMYEKGVCGVCKPIRSLRYVLENKPSAELKPKDSAGNVTQFDENDLQRSYEQMNIISEYMLYARSNSRSGKRRLNAREIFDKCKLHDAFANVSDDELFKMLKTSYEKWTMAQHKIHASPLAPSFGKNVDHQSSMRTPNLSGNYRDEIILLAIDLHYERLKKNGIAVDEKERSELRKKAWQDKEFAENYYKEI